MEHLADWCPDALRFLGLPPGWRFLVAGAYADAWEDPQLLRPDVAVVDTKCAETLGDEDLTSISDTELAEIEQRCAAATPGPWRAFVEGRDHESGSSFIQTAAWAKDLLHLSVIK